MKVSAIFFLSLALRVAYAIWNGFFGPAPGADGDALAFLLEANEINSFGWNFVWGIGATSYVNLLSIVVSVFGESAFAPSLVSVIAWCMSALLFLKTLDVILPRPNFRNAKILPFALYSLMPLEIIYGSIQMREPFQLLFVNCIMYGAVKIIIDDAKSYWAIMLIGAVGAGALHGALTVFCILALISVPVYQTVFIARSLSLVKLLGVLVTVMIVGYSGYSLFTSGTTYNFSDGAFDAARRYQEGTLLIESRAQYKTSAVGSDDALTFILGSLTGIFQYMAEPFPWKISNATDLILFFENIVRFTCLVLIFNNLRKLSATQRKTLLFIVFLFLLQELIWSLGTTNWGTASRHHYPALGLLFAAYAISRTKTTDKKRIQNLNRSR
jgi:hypothetical protein